MSKSSPRTYSDSSRSSSRSSWLVAAAWFLVFSLVASFCFWQGFRGSSPPTDLSSSSLAHQEVDPAVEPADNESQVRTKAIQDVRVGMRTAGKNPLRDQVDPNAPEPDPDTWRKLVLQIGKESGYPLNITLLRPLEWIEAAGAVVGAPFFLELPKMGAVGDADVLAIEPCPPIQPGLGNVVTGTFHHEADPDTEILRLEFSNGAVVKGVTENHPFWSVDHGDYVPAGELAEGYRVKVVNGFAFVVAIESRSAQAGEMLYNLEVYNEHVYQVTETGVLVHNSCVVNDVLNESASALGPITSGFRLSQSQAINAGLRWLGPGYREIGRPGSGVFVSQDGFRRFRMDTNSLLGRHRPNVPHVHFEWLRNATDRYPTGNNHVPIY